MKYTLFSLNIKSDKYHTSSSESPSETGPAEKALAGGTISRGSGERSPKKGSVEDFEEELGPAVGQKRLNLVYIKHCSFGVSNDQGR